MIEFIPCFVLCHSDEEDGVHHDDAVVGRSTLMDLCNEAAKLKSMGCMNQVLLYPNIVAL